MSKELVISSNRHETRVAILEDDQLVEVYFQRSNEYSLAGSIHKGRVTRVLPGMQSAFVDLGLERDTFLYVSDFFEENEEYDKISGTDDKPARGGFTRRDGRPDRQAQPQAHPQPTVKEVEQAVTALEPPVVEAAVVAAPAVERPDGGGGDRDRGRRSRRRRNRGRGLPDSKYASDVDSPAVEAVAPAATAAGEEPEIAEPAEEPADVILLPGESLAKYSRPSRPPYQKQAPREAKAEPAAHAEAKTAEAPFEPVSVRQEEVVSEPVIPSGFPEPAFFVPPVESEFGSAAATAREPEPEVQPAPEPVQHAISLPETSAAPNHSTTAAEAAAAALDPTASNPEAAMEEALQIAAVEAQDEIEPSGALSAEVDLVEEDGSEQDAAEPDAPQETVASAEAGEKPLSASVRDPGTRFQHRGPRGMRRKRRGGGGGEGRGDRPE
jgi:hypothetical protein